MYRNIALSFLLLFYIINNLSAQQTIKEVELLNDYVNYANEAAHSMSLIYGELEQFNKDSYHQIGKSRPLLTYNSKDIKDIRSAYLIPIDRLLTKCKTNSKNLPKAENDQLLTIADSLNMVLQTMYLYRDSIINYTKKKEYKTDKNLEQAYAFLEKSEGVYKHFNRLFFSLEQTINQTNDNYKYSNRSNPYVRVTNSMTKAIGATKAVLQAGRDNDYNALDKAHDQLFNDISLLIDRKQYNLSGIMSSTSSSNGLEPEHLYANFINELSEFYKHTQTFLSNRNVKDKWKGRGYEFYNGLFLNRYNTSGGGIVKAYNQMIEQSNVSLLKLMEAPNIFITFPSSSDTEVDITEPAEEIPVADIITTDTIAVAENDTQETTIKETKEQLKAKIGKPTLKGFQANNLVLLLDVSASMNKPEKLPVLKESLIYLLSLMRPEDYISIVVYSGKASVALSPTSSQERQKIIDAINDLKSGGGTNVIKGLSKSMKVAKDNFIDDGNNRIILATDGGFEMSKSLFRKAEQISNQKLSLSVFYLNKIEFTTYAAKFKELAATGKGSYNFVNKNNAKVVLLKEAQSIQE